MLIAPWAIGYDDSDMVCLLGLNVLNDRVFALLAIVIDTLVETANDHYLSMVSAAHGVT